ncbi:MAG TPA: hypothetical protein VHL58_04995 [Thermoanaerobaculia bacterium]|nr:hypothetical protein [Thermoanaerobaculia bacterium]
MALQTGVDEISRDLAAISRLTAIDTILHLLTKSTGLRLALVARITDDSWTACAVLDDCGFGLKVGDQLELVTTY